MNSIIEVSVEVNFDSFTAAWEHEVHVFAKDGA